jgi:hypothetical protein
MHVHVQAPSDLKVLKQLALILIVYEEEISRLHPPCRRPKHLAARGTVESNRMGVMEHPHDIKTWKFDPSTTALKRKFEEYDKHEGPVEGIRLRLHRIPDKEALARYMNAPAMSSSPRGNRNRQVNFLSVVRGDDFPSTVEFRQARGSLCPEEISRWVDFCIGLIRLAYLYHNHPRRFPTEALGDYYDGEGNLQGGGVSVFDLIRDMELDGEAVWYWELRMARYAMGTHGDADDRTDNELPPPEPSDNGSWLDEEEDEDESEYVVM